MSARVVVLGAGPAGLGAAYRTARTGHEVVVLERAAVPGGAASSFEIAGVRVDYGSHRLHPSIDPGILQELRDLLGADLQRRLRNGRIRLAGRWIAFPLRAKDLLTRLPPSLALGAARDAATGWARRPRSDTFAEVLRAGVGPALFERFYRPYARKLWGLEPEEISGEQARRRVAANSARELLRRVANGSRQAPYFWYPRRGYGAISEALAAAAKAAGADLRFSCAARRVELGPRTVRVLTGEGASVEGDLLWSTIPLPALAGMCDPGPPPEVRAAASSLRHRAMVFVYLAVAAGRYTPYDAHYLPEAFTPVTRISEPKNYRDGDDPPDRTVLCFEIPCAPEGELYAASDDALTGVAVETLHAAGFPRVGAVLEVAVRRLRHVYPVYRVGFRRALDAVDAWAAAQPRLLTFGRQGLFVHDNAHHALAMAWAAAEALGRGERFDPDAWTAARRRFASHVVED